MHIYVISRVHGKSPTKWRQTLAQLRRSREYFPLPYAPLRLALASELRQVGSGEQVLEAGLANLHNRPQGATIRDRSRAAFRNFVAQFRPQIDRLEEDYTLPRSAVDPITYSGHQLRGSFHFRVRDNEGNSRLVFAHASGWDEQEVDAYLELLTLISEERHAGNRDDVWFLDLYNNRRIPTRTPFRRRRQALLSTMELLDLLVQANNDQDIVEME